MKRILFVLVCFLLGCTQVTRIDYTEYVKVSPENVDVSFNNPPKCYSIKEIAVITTPMHWNMDIAVSAARDKAADLGADGIIIRNYHRNAFNDVSIDVSAYKCINENK